MEIILATKAETADASLAGWGITYEGRTGNGPRNLQMQSAHIIKLLSWPVLVRVEITTKNGPNRQRE